VREFEKLPESPRDDMGLPASIFFLSDEIIIFDHLFHTIKVVACADLRDGRRPTKKLYDSVCRRIDSVIRKIEAGRAAAMRPSRAARAGVLSKIVSNTSRGQFLAAVARAKKYIMAGDVIQVVLSQRFESRSTAAPFDVYRALRMINPSPYMYFFRFKDFFVIGSSPEILVRKEGSLAVTKPIAGTRPRAADPAEDARLASELLADPKERAEHIMLVDLGRNDLSRVCRPGTVKTSELMRIEKYSHVMHMVSTVTGALNAGADAFDLFRACFPAGTVTGAPKVRAMQIIDELEKSARGPYAGAVGYFSYDGNMDTAITIRTIIRKGHKSYVQAGAGIVADSVGSKEQRETQNKARALFRAIELAGRL
ncbi:MAG: anthranilate synthase component I family protein, partial [Endomicrobiia bacterium]|nr:anthranilate synthase component I family protein [Endomicrobiia bacterium]